MDKRLLACSHGGKPPHGDNRMSVFWLTAVARAALSTNFNLLAQSVVCHSLSLSPRIFYTGKYGTGRRKTRDADR